MMSLLKKVNKDVFQLIGKLPSSSQAIIKGKSLLSCLTQKLKKVKALAGKTPQTTVKAPLRI